jgi:MFS family permease
MEESSTGPRRAALAFIFVTVVLDMLALGMIVPVLPKLVVSFEGGDTGSAARIYGLFGTVWALMQFIFSPVLGALSDRFGRRPVILLSNLGLGLDYLLMAWGADPRLASSSGASSRESRPRRSRRPAPTSRTSRRPSVARNRSGSSARPSASASCSALRSAGFSATSVPACRSGSRAAAAS